MISLPIPVRIPLEIVFFNFACKTHFSFPFFIRTRSYLSPEDLHLGNEWCVMISAPLALTFPCRLFPFLTLSSPPVPELPVLFLGEGESGKNTVFEDLNPIISENSSQISLEILVNFSDG